MPESMRRQSAKCRKRDNRDEEQSSAQQQTVDLLQSSSEISARDLCSQTRVSLDIYYRIRRAIRSKDDQLLKKMLNPAKHRAGKRRVITCEEKSMICDRLIYAASRGFAAEKLDVKCSMARIACDGRNEYYDGFPSDDVVRSFTTGKRNITYRNSENKDIAKLQGENYGHVKTYADVLRQVDRDFPGMLHDPERIWNMDETAVSAEYGKKVKAFVSASTHHGGFKSVTTNQGPGLHVRAVIAVSASGKVAPPFVIVAGKNVMSRWFLPLRKDRYKVEGSSLFKLGEGKWLPTDGYVCTTENGSMEMDIIPKYIEHLDRFVRKTVPRSAPYLLCLDVHSSRNGIEWLELAVRKNCQVVQSPSSPSHILQPCDQYVNKKFQSIVRESRDSLCKLWPTDTKAIQIKLMCAVRGYEGITVKDVQESFKSTSLWPMDFKFAERYKHHSDGVKEEGKEQLRRIECCGPASRLLTVQQRRSDSTTYQRLTGIVHGPDGASTKLRDVQVLLRTQQTVNSILMSLGPSKDDSRTNSSLKNRQTRERNTALISGTPALYLTHGEVIEAKTARIEREAQNVIEKENARKMKEMQKRVAL